jgi:hypothetical protein
MGSPILSIISEIFLQHFETCILKHYLENKSLVFYKRYVDNILILYDQDKVQHHQIIRTANNIHPNLTFNHTLEINGAINFLDLSINRTETNITIDIYRKPTATSTVIHISNHPQEHKNAAFHFLLNRMHNLPLTEQQKKKRMGKYTLHSQRQRIHREHNRKT